MMTDATRAEIRRRLEINEGVRYMVYDDATGEPPAVPGEFAGYPTIGVGLNLRNGDAAEDLAKVGAPSLHDVLLGRAGLTQAQVDALLDLMLPRYVDAARASLAPGSFDALAPARQCAVVDCEYNLGQAGWGRYGANEGFATTRAIISQAQAAKDAGRVDVAHSLFVAAGAHLHASAWDSQIGNRALRDEAMMRTGQWCAATGDGSDVG